MSLTLKQTLELKRQLECLELKMLDLLALAHSSSDRVELDQARMGRVSRGDALLQQSMAKAGHSRTEDRLIQVRQALKRIERDEYGDCLHCFKAISVERLQLAPETPLCIECQAQIEG